MVIKIKIKLKIASRKINNNFNRASRLKITKLKLKFKIFSIIRIRSKHKIIKSKIFPKHYKPLNIKKIEN